MAGIGFELKKIVRQGTMASYLQVALSGAMIVAGPWLITILAIGLIQRFYRGALGEGPDLFLATVVYTYTGSLLLFGGVHYLFSRILSDLLYEKKERNTLAYLGWFLLVVGLLSALAGAGIGGTIQPEGIRNPLAYRVCAGFFFLFVSLHWLFIVYASLLRWYGRILIVYTGGMGLALLSAALLSPQWGVAGVLAGFASGNLGILAGLTILILKFRQEARGLVEKKGFKEVFVECSRGVWKYAKTQGDLFLTGYFYYLGMWIDKILFWVGKGQQVEGTWFRVFPSYDVLVYYTNLTMIPGLVFFVVFTETGFATILRKFLEGLSRRTYLNILKEKRRLYSESLKYLRDLGLFQGCVTLSAALLSFWLIPSSPFPGTVWVLLWGVFFHLLYFVLTSFLFFLEAYRGALVTAVLFFGVNLLVTLVSVGAGQGINVFSLLGGGAEGGKAAYLLAGNATGGFPVLFPPGAGYLLGTFVAVIVSGGIFLVTLRRIDSRIFSRAAE